MLKKQTKESKQISSQVVSIPDELKRLADFFSILIAIDKRVNGTKSYEKQDK